MGCGDCKKLLAESLEEVLVPIRTRAAALDADRKRVRDVLADGSAKCRKRAAETMREVRSTMGLYESASS